MDFVGSAADGHVVTWYGLFLALALAGGLAAGVWQVKRRGEPLAVLLDLTLYGAAAAVAGARLWYAAAYWPLYEAEPAKIFYLWQGGFRFWGAALGLGIVFIFYLKIKGLSLRRWADLLAPSLALSIAVGQGSVFFSQQSVGMPTASRLGVYIDYALRPAGYTQYSYFHPLPLYYAAWCLAVFGSLVLAGRLDKRDGFGRGGYLFFGGAGLFFFGMFFIEYLRVGAPALWGLKLGQAAALAGVILAIAGCGCCRWRAGGTSNAVFAVKRYDVK